MMQTMRLGVSALRCSRLAYGCWRVAGTWDPAGVTPELCTAGKLAIKTAFECGYTLFDTADIYCRGESERLLGEALAEIPEMRSRVTVATKCGVRFKGEPNLTSPQRYDFSADHILRSCEASLKRLRIETIDLYMLHRPDYLCDPEEVARAFSELKNSGKVRFFGVSNFRPTLVTALQVACPMPLVVNQVEISMARLNAFEDGTLDQCLIEKLTPMAWSPLAGGLIGEGAKRLLPAQQQYRVDRLLPVLDELAHAHRVPRTAVALAWLMKHPARIMPIVGSADPQRIKHAAQADAVELSREEWYHLLLAARGEPLP
jgi:predicted oxidoreductase